jgi:hypothetical protein
MPFDIAMSMEPASSGVSVEAPPSVYSTSISRPASTQTAIRIRARRFR